MSAVQTIYDELWIRARPLFERNRCEVDPLVCAPTDMRRGLTLRARPGPEIIERVGRFSDVVREMVPGQYFTPSSDLHVTVLSIVSCNVGFDPAVAPVGEYVDLISGCLEKAVPFRIAFRGITASPSCLLLQGHPVDGRLAALRDQLRTAFKASGLACSIDSRYPAIAAHMTIMRLVRPSADLEALSRLISGSRDLDFGEQEVDALELVHNDWCHKADNTRILAALPLQTGRD